MLSVKHDEILYLSFSSQIGLNPPAGNFARAENRPDTDARRTSENTQEGDRVITVPLPQISDDTVENSHDQCFILYRGQFLPCGFGISNRLVDPVFFPRPRKCGFLLCDIKRWEQSAMAIHELLEGKSPQDYKNMVDELYDQFYEFIINNGFSGGLEESSPNIHTKLFEEYENLWYAKRVGERTKEILLVLLPSFIPLTAVYGGVHLAAWNFQFSSRAESILWRTACVVIMGSSPFLLALPTYNFLGNYVSLMPISQFMASENNDRIPHVPFWLKILIFIIRLCAKAFAVSLSLCYAASRLYLVVESFLSLRHVPIGVYAAVPWVQNLPHV